MSNLLSPERLAAIRAQSNEPRARNTYVTDYGVAADVVDELLDHIDARDQQVKAELQKLLTRKDILAVLTGEDLGRAENRDLYVRRAASALGITLE